MKKCDLPTITNKTTGVLCNIILLLAQDTMLSLKHLLTLHKLSTRVILTYTVPISRSTGTEALHRPYRPQGEQRYSSTLSRPTALKGGEGSASRPGRSLPQGKTRYLLYRRLGGPQGRSGQMRKISPPTEIRSPDRPARSRSLYRLSYPAHSVGPHATETISDLKPSETKRSHDW